MKIHQTESPWTEEKKAKLTRLWNQTGPELSTAKIAEALHVTKNAAVAQAHRLKLPGRGSPIKPPSNKPPAARPLRSGTSTLPPLPSECSA